MNFFRVILEKTREASDNVDGTERLAVQAASLENELLWQHTYGQRRPVQR